MESEPTFLHLLHKDLIELCQTWYSVWYWGMIYFIFGISLTIALTHDDKGCIWHTSVYQSPAQNLLSTQYTVDSW